MREHRGSSARTLDDYRRYVVEFVAALHGRRWRRLSAGSIRTYVIERRRETTPARMLAVVRALRMFIRFLVATGCCPSHLDRAVPSVPHWRLATLPRYLSAKDVEQIVWKNPVRFFGQSGRLDLDETPVQPKVDQRELWEGNSVLRGQPPRVDP